MNAEALFGDADDISLSSDDGEEERKGDEDKEREKDSDTERRRSDEDRSPRREETVRRKTLKLLLCAKKEID